MKSRAQKDDDNRAFADESSPQRNQLFARYMTEISKHGILNKEEEIAVAKKAHRYKDVCASHSLVLSNLRLVVKIALEYHNAYTNILDLIQQGNVGLIESVKKFNPYKGTRFSSYASFRIRAYIRKYLIDSRNLVQIKTGQRKRRVFYGLNRETRRLCQIGVEPKPEVLAQRLNVTATEVEDMQRMFNALISLDYPMVDDEHEHFGNLIPADQNVEEDVAEKEITEIVRVKIIEFKRYLSQKQLYILENRIMAEEPQTLNEIGKRFTISRERVRQLESSLIKQLGGILEAKLGPTKARASRPTQLSGFGLI